MREFVDQNVFHQIMRFLDLRGQKAMSETCRQYNQWTNRYTLWAVTTSSANPQPSGPSAAKETPKQRLIDDYNRHTARQEAKRTNVKTAGEKDLNSTLFSRTFFETVKKAPFDFVAKFGMTSRVMTVLNQLMQTGVPIMKQLEAKIADCHQTIAYLHGQQNGSLKTYLDANREETTEEYNREERFLKGLDDEPNPTDETLLAFLAAQAPRSTELTTATTNLATFIQVKNTLQPNDQPSAAPSSPTLTSSAQ